jgi:hypothetical protein
MTVKNWRISGLLGSERRQAEISDAISSNRIGQARIPGQAQRAGYSGRPFSATYNPCRSVTVLILSSSKYL